MKTLYKDSFREIYKSFGRFISIMMIIALGVGFFAGIKATAPDMKITADKYFKENNLFDISLKSTMGFDEKDLNKLKELEEINKAQLAYSLDVIVKDKKNSFVTKLISIPLGYKNAINKPILKEGRMPENSGECLLEYASLKNRYKIGDLIELESGKDEGIDEYLNNNKLRVVGFANSSQYLSLERDSSDIGNGKVNSFIMIGEDEFNLPYYTDMYLLTKKSNSFETYSDDYKEYLNRVKKDIEKVGNDRKEARLNDLKKELNKKLREGQEKLEEEKNNGKVKLDKANQEINKGKKDLDFGKSQLSSYNSELKSKIDRANYKLKTEEDRILKEKENLDLEYNNFIKNKPLIEEKLKEAEKNADKLKVSINDISLNIKEVKEKIELSSSEEEVSLLKVKLEKLKENKKKLEDKLKILEKEIEKNRDKLKDSEVKLNTASQDIQKGLTKIKKERNNLNKEKHNSLKKLSIEQKNLKESEEKLENAKVEYQKASKKYEDGIKQGDKKLSKLEKEIDKLEKPKWYVINRTDTRDYIEFEMAADRIDAVAKVFPLFFFIIALLVCLTTMTRMVDEQRNYIGLLKALGYRDINIMSKYIIYALSASIIGSILGLIIGFKVFPTVIFNSYRLMYIMPEIVIEFNIKYALISLIAAVITTSLAAFLSVYKELREVPSKILRPKAPKEGQRILLEKIGFIWHKLKFSQKVTARNLFRYKKRLFMTVIGISGCTALLLAGFGLKDSIMSISINQFDKIFKYDLAFDMQGGLEKNKNTEVFKYIDGDSRIKDYLYVNEKLIDVKKNSISKNTNLVITEDTNKIKDFISLKDRKSNKDIELKDDGVIISEKLGQLLKVKAGDYIDLIIEEKPYKVRVSNITENYAYHYIYMTKDFYRSTIDNNLDYNKVLVNTSDNSEKADEILSEDLLKLDDITATHMIKGMSKSLNDTIGSLDYVIMVIIVSAGVLAFIVLYNLTNINISERIREIATIKVLGFYDDEVSRYVYRENNILTIMGVIVGLLLGIVLHRFILNTTEIEMIMFGRKIRLQSYIYATILTLTFSFLVNVVMYFKLKKVNMVESLKSVD